MSTQPNNRPLGGSPHVSEIGVAGIRAHPDDGAGMTPDPKSRVGEAGHPVVAGPATNSDRRAEDSPTSRQSVSGRSEAATIQLLPDLNGAFFGPLDIVAEEKLTAAQRTSPATAFDHLNSEVDLPLVTCPQCGEVASIEWDTTIDQMLHLKIRCISRHWFLLPAEMVDTYPSA